MSLNRIRLISVIIVNSRKETIKLLLEGLLQCSNLTGLFSVQNSDVLQV